MHLDVDAGQRQLADAVRRWIGHDDTFEQRCAIMGSGGGMSAAAFARMAERA